MSKRVTIQWVKDNPKEAAAWINANESEVKKLSRQVVRLKNFISRLNRILVNERPH